ncbi:conserved hypothetical protein [Burkholderia pseudomallei S13]|uniref:Uncharacterized protein n=1 Tax=Burkholderia pseudomallei (strain 1710b) TaxID=320372 RepID=Q3JY30_BURP1|nr:hypothetical protein BURPS1710b_0106 [Burkholderia pseudomallei 1710b]EDS84239.1 conserved hypothetical protein [Burkholderia pseudomallei S13]
MAEPFLLGAAAPACAALAADRASAMRAPERGAGRGESRIRHASRSRRR